MLYPGSKPLGDLGHWTELHCQRVEQEGRGCSQEITKGLRCCAEASELHLQMLRSSEGFKAKRHNHTLL